MRIRRHTSALRTLGLGVAIGLLLVAPAFGHSSTVTQHHGGFAVEHGSISDAVYWPPDAGYQYNGWKVYLSPAHHWHGYNYGCSTYIEDTAMAQAADEAAIGAGWDLRARGYLVRVGAADPDENVTRSNGWGSGSKRRYIAIHSNANPGSGGCTSSPDDTGTKTYYFSSAGKNWLWAEQNWAWRIGWAVDTNLGYP